ncbi:MAG: hypothetical protein R3C10_00655 [Pirellulales bacterium]
MRFSILRLTLAAVMITSLVGCSHRHPRAKFRQSLAVGQEEVRH